MKFCKKLCAYLLTAALAVTTLAAGVCAAEVPESLKPWLNSKTGKAMAQMAGEKAYIEMSVGGETVTTARSGGKSYTCIQLPDDGGKYVTIVRDGYTYEILSMPSLVLKSQNETAPLDVGLGEVKDVVEAEGVSYTITPAQQKVGDKVYDAEILTLTQGEVSSAITYCFEGDTLRYVVTKDSEGAESITEYKKISTDVDESLFELPAGVPVYVQTAEGTLVDEAGNPVDMAAFYALFMQ